MLKAKDIMTTEVISVTPQTGLKELAALFQEHSVSSMPVINEQDDLVGMITTTDLIDCDKTLHIPTVISIFDWVLYLESEKDFAEQVRRISAQTVAEICTTDVITCSAQTPVSEVAELMVQHKVHLIPVVDSLTVIGVIARLDIIRAVGV